ncbi:hypothetical protein CQ14_25975 [Bradyrhizobium lablabi]|uniref:Uncharacterized protein n=1 Tax=Bradyrhizobium lablabi TaxID=722472 RepID=A0A0R3MIG7_9BRAD|nr:hypothetical protein CQ14_25975 [Bradyrhizobium lablabi]
MFSKVYVAKFEIADHATIEHVDESSAINQIARKTVWPPRDNPVSCSFLDLSKPSLRIMSDQGLWRWINLRIFRAISMSDLSTKARFNVVN